jgi:hypothetical protein
MATATATLPETYFLQAAGGDSALSYDAIDMRLVIGAIFPKPGSCRTNDFWVQQKAAPGWGVLINGGFYVAGGSTNHDRYVAYCPTQTTVDLPGGWVTNPAAIRTHKVYLSIYDKLATGTLYGSKINITEDTGAGAPVPSDNPIKNELLATFTISPGQSYVGDAHITNVAPKASQGVGNTAVPLAGGYISGEASTQGGPPRYQVVGSRVHFSGTVAKSSGDFPTSTVTIATMPIGIRPKYQRYVGALAAGGMPYRLTINTDGTVQVSELASTRSWISLDGAFYEID